jgi:hypothetical protein
MTFQSTPISLKYCSSEASNLTLIIILFSEMLKFSIFNFIYYYFFNLLRNINFLKENEESDGRFENIHRLLKWNPQNQLIIQQTCVKVANTLR